MWVYFPLSVDCPHGECFWEGFWGELCTPAPGSYVDLSFYLFSMLTEHKELQFDCTALQETQDTSSPLHTAILDGNFLPCGYHLSNSGLCSCWLIGSPDSVTSRHQESALVCRKMPQRNEQFVCLQQAGRQHPYCWAVPGAATGLGDLAPCAFCTVSNSPNSTHCVAGVSGSVKEKGIFNTMEMCGCHSSAPQQKTPLGCI